MATTVKMHPLPRERYGKAVFRKKQAALPFPEKVRQVVALQERLRPIYAARGKVIVPWKLDADEVIS